jgi:hypothetical protein
MRPCWSPEKLSVSLATEERLVLAGARGYLADDGNETLIDLPYDLTA